MGMLGPLNRRRYLHQDRCPATETAHTPHYVLCMARMEVRSPNPCPEATDVKESKCLRLATGDLWYISSRQFHEDLGVPLFADHIRAVNARFDLKLVDVGILLRQLAVTYTDLRLTPVALRGAKDGRRQLTSQRHR